MSADTISPQFGNFYRMSEVDSDPNRLGDTPRHGGGWHFFGDWQTGAFFGFLGGVIPTLLKLATAAVASEAIDMPRFTFWIGLLIFGVVGASVSVAFRQHTTREAFISGIVAPSLVANAIGGYSEGAAKRPLKTSELAQITWSLPQLTTEANAQSGGPMLTRPASLNKIDFEWDLKRKDVPVQKLRVFFWKVAGDLATSKSIFVSPKFDGELAVPPDYNYVSVEDSKPIKIPPGTSQLIIHGDVRTSLRNDFFWALGSQRQYKIENPSAEIHSSANVGD